MRLETGTTSTGQTLYRRARSCLPATGRHWRIKGIGKPALIGQIGIASTRGEVWSIDDLMLSQLAPPWLPFAASAFARKSVISPSSQLSSTRCRQRRRRLSISLSSAPCRPTALLETIARRYGLKLFGNIAPGVPASSPFKARLGARTCIKPCVVRSLRLPPNSTSAASP